MKTIILFFVILLLVGCAVNPYYKFYADQTNGADLTQLPNIVLTDKEPEIYQGSDITDDIQKMMENGYINIGYSSFNAGNVNPNQAISHAKNIKAEIVLVYSEYTNTVSGSVPLTLPDSETSTTNTSGNIWGVGSYNETSKTATNKSKTYDIPYSVNRYDYFASFWVKTKELKFGVHLRELATNERRLIGSNKGVIITAVINNSPAFMSDLFADDILKQMGDTEIINMESVSQAVRKYKGKSVKVIIWRDGKTILKDVQLND